MSDEGYEGADAGDDVDDDLDDARRDGDDGGGDSPLREGNYSDAKWTYQLPQA